MDAACRGLVAALGAGGWLQHSGAGASERLDVRSLCLIRETLARHDGLADFAFAMQGLGPTYDPARQLGGAVYLFLRGIAGPASGCCAIAAPLTLIDAIDAMLPASFTAPGREPA